MLLFVKAQQFQTVLLQSYTNMYELQERQEKQKYDVSLSLYFVEKKNF